MSQKSLIKCSLTYVILFLMLGLQQIDACVDFIIQAKDGSFIVGRSLEFGTLLPTQIEIHPRGEKVQSHAPNNQNGLSWTSKYAYSGLTIFNSVINGFNEKGLVCNALWFPDGQYPSLSNNVPSNAILDFADIGSWLLGNFTTTDEVKQNFPKVPIYFHEISELKQVPPIHLMVHDSQGKSIVVEYNNGKLDIFDNPIGVLTNSPSLPWHITNLRNYLNLSAINSGPKIIDGKELFPPGQGSGLQGIPGDWTPPSRFIRAAFFKQLLQQPNNAADGVNAAFHLLNTLDIPYGVVRGSKNSDFDYTQWVTVMDIINGKLFFRTYENQNIQVIDMQKEKLDVGSPIRKFAINSMP